jgi:hypothetical protein
VSFDRTVGVDVVNFEAAGSQMPGDEYGAMAFQRFFFRAHYDHAVSFHAFLDAIQSLMK